MMYGTVSGSGSTTLHATVCATLSHRGFGIYVYCTEGNYYCTSAALTALIPTNNFLTLNILSYWVPDDLSTGIAVTS
jgi:hypothetical protein